MFITVLFFKIGANTSEEGIEVQQFTIYIASTPGQYTVSNTTERLDV